MNKYFLLIFLVHVSFSQQQIRNEKITSTTTPTARERSIAIDGIVNQSQPSLQILNNLVNLLPQTTASEKNSTTTSMKYRSS